MMCRRRHAVAFSGNSRRSSAPCLRPAERSLGNSAAAPRRARGDGPGREKPRRRAPVSRHRVGGDDRSIFAFQISRGARGAGPSLLSSRSAQGSGRRAAAARPSGRRKRGSRRRSLRRGYLGSKDGWCGRRAARVAGCAGSIRPREVPDPRNGTARDAVPFRRSRQKFSEMSRWIELQEAMNRACSWGRRGCWRRPIVPLMASS